MNLNEELAEQLGPVLERISELAALLRAGNAGVNVCAPRGQRWKAVAARSVFASRITVRVSNSADESCAITVFVCVSAELQA